MMFCKRESAAAKAYQRNLMKVMGIYVAMVIFASWYVKHHHPQGWVLFAMATLPCVPVLAMLVTMGVYLRDEKDEFQRNNMIKALLCATGVTLGITTFFSFLRGYGWQGSLPPFTEFMSFFLVFAAGKWWYEFTNRVPEDE